MRTVLGTEVGPFQRADAPCARLRRSVSARGTSRAARPAAYDRARRRSASPRSRRWCAPSRMKNPTLVLALMFLAGLLAGAAAVALSSGGATAARGRQRAADEASAPERTVPKEPASKDTAPKEAACELAGPGEPRTAPSAEPRRVRDGDEGPLFSDALRSYARDEILRGWSETRRDPMPEDVLARLLSDYEELLRSAPALLGRKEAEAATLRDSQRTALERGSGVEWLRALKGNESEIADLPQAPERFAELFRPKSSGRLHDGTTLAADDVLGNGDVLTYPAGVFLVDDLARGRDPFPTDVTLRGAGMDATLLVMDELSPRSALERFSVEDCTVFADGGIADVRTDPTLLALRRVRVVGFDCGAGGSYALNLRGCALSAAQCRFESGYGRNPDGHANLIRDTTPLVARFDGCTFERVSLAGARLPSVVFAGCEMHELLDEPPEGPVYANCRITVLPREHAYDAEVRRRDLNDLFPGWRERVQRR